MMVAVSQSVYCASSPLLLLGHPLLLLQCGVPPKTDPPCHPSQTDPMQVFHRHQFFKNCSNMEPYHRVHPSGASCSNMCPPQVTAHPQPWSCMGSSPLLSMGCSSGLESALAGTLYRPQTPLGQIHLLHHGLLHGLQRDLLHVGPMGNSLLHQGSLHRLQGNFCCMPGAPPALLLH